MKLQAVFTREELVSFASQWLPLKLLLGDARKEERYLLLTDPKTIDLIPGSGLRIACRAQIRWPVLGVSVPITARHLSVLLRPTIQDERGQPALIFRLKIEQADLSGVPARLDATVTEAVDRALSERVKLAFRFGNMLTRSIPMPALLTTTESIELGVQSGTVEVSADAFRFELAVGASTNRRRPVP